MTLLVIPTIAPGYARAQGEADAAAMADQQRGELRDSLTQEACERDPFQRDTIVVCAEVGAEEATRAVMSPLPQPVQSSRNLVEGLRVQPCWLTRAPGVICVRGGIAPPQVVLIDLDQFPDALTAEEAAQVYAVEDGPP